MIDASQFASQHNSFWSDQTPTSEHFVRRANLEHLERWAPPLSKPAKEIRAAFVAEHAFSRFCGLEAGLTGHELEQAALTDARNRLTPLTDNPKQLAEEFSDDERKQEKEIAARLSGFFHRTGEALVARPLFPGCGYVDASEGDIIVGNALYEVKAVERPMRSIDLRQLLIYCALNHASQKFELESIGIFNPRRGIFFEMEVEAVSREVSGEPPQHLFERVIHAISSGDISR